MKKIFMTLVAVCFAATMNAQVYVGGSLGFNAWSSQENAGDRSETTFKIMPEIGYNINDSWAIGTCQKLVITSTILGLSVPLSVTRATSGLVLMVSARALSL